MSKCSKPISVSSYTSKDWSDFNFTIANNDGTNRIGVDAVYDLKIITTTNLPLRYELYRDQSYNANGAVNIISSTTSVATDSDASASFSQYPFEPEMKSSNAA